MDIYTLKRKHNDVEKWYKRKCSDFFQITPTQGARASSHKLPPVAFFVRQSVTYAHVSASQTNFDWLRRRSTFDYIKECIFSIDMILSRSFLFPFSLSLANRSSKPIDWLLSHSVSLGCYLVLAIERMFFSLSSRARKMIGSFLPSNELIINWIITLSFRRKHEEIPSHTHMNQHL